MKVAQENNWINYIVLTKLFCFFLLNELFLFFLEITQKGLREEQNPSDRPKKTRGCEIC